MRHPFLGSLCVTVLAMSLFGVGGAPASAGGPPEVRTPPGDLVADSYLVVLNDAPVHATAAALADSFSGEVTYEYTTVLRGFAVRTSARAAQAIARDPRVAYVEQDVRAHVTDVQRPATWGLDRIDQRDLPLDTAYTYRDRAAGVHAYVIDTGLAAGHPDFGGRASLDFDAIVGPNPGGDCHGHGTHVAGTIGSATWGVAKGVRLHGVRVISCWGSGQGTSIIAGVEWVTRNHVKPAVVNMSIGVRPGTALESAVRRSIAAGITYTVAAANDNKDACGSSPALVPEAITVGATTNTDARPPWSNWGPCLDLFAPGLEITSTVPGGTGVMSGTSMAAPHVAGAAALYLADHPGATPAGVRDALVAAATKGRITNPGPGSPNALLYSLVPGAGPPHA
jgi:subtilisin family serine protease